MSRMKADPTNKARNENGIVRWMMSRMKTDLRDKARKEGETAMSLRSNACSEINGGKLSCQLQW